AQEWAKDLINESLRIFDSLALRDKAAEARVELSWCYYREGAFNEARVVLREVLGGLTTADGESFVLASIRLADVERIMGRGSEALKILEGVEGDGLDRAGPSARGKFHSTRAGALESLGFQEGRPDLTDRALVELAAASFHFEAAGHARYLARVENNHGFLLIRLRRFEEAAPHLERARRLFVKLKEEASVAQVDETRARSLLALGRNAEAERLLRVSVRTLEKGDDRSLLADALIALGVAQVRLGRLGEASAAFERATGIYDLLGDGASCGRALLDIVEEIGDGLRADELRDLYLNADRMLAGSEHAETLARLRACARRLIRADGGRREAGGAGPNYIYASPKSEAVLNETREIARGSGAVLISGETGTGKELLARMVHLWSGRRGRFVAVNCATLCDSLFESQLFGHRKGSFTDALADHAGLAREADGGTLYLDEVGELSAANQAKLLRFIDSGEFCTLGNAVPEHVDVRIVSATNHDLRERAARGLFRRDLFYRLAALQIVLPPLRERSEDIPALARHFIAEVGLHYGRRVTFTDESVEAMSLLPLPGNARELRALVERTFITAPDGAVVTAGSVEIVARRDGFKATLASPWEGCSFEEEVCTYEGRLIRLALESAGGSVTRAARLLNVSHQRLAHILKTRHKTLLPVRTPVRRRRVSLIPAAKRTKADR
ncbi:MAG: sigma 54-interacting transcriptional regulator, partial [Acidobacteria bacterium]|nr:sigma 54-interacting transcriptional regulator [Acidobacteriota bacterium]